MEARNLLQALSCTNKAGLKIVPREGSKLQECPELEKPKKPCTLEDMFVTKHAWNADGNTNFPRFVWGFLVM